MKHSRQMNRALNLNILEHDNLDIYWFGFSDGQYLINYPIHEYYQLDDVSQCLGRMLQMMGNLDNYVFADLNQTELNAT